eukprot:CAMPEP_0117450724 /NCGR_PEP_ID=MMETSP0759-20121206/8622_1 /TAXON_ID=63605 /ORGANISM="Percolomonas cosmopolitus, Strain WS" /LENGTH=110 /DNA_ID=CAMNT_0005243267 /DNA_START=10 /DNA_END=342 /DNA_ORIENTATION=-
MSAWRFMYALATCGAISLTAIAGIKLRNESFSTMQEMRELKLRADLKKELLERRDSGKTSELERVLNELVVQESMQEGALWEGAQEVFDDDDVQDDNERERRKIHERQSL